MHIVEGWYLAYRTIVTRFRAKHDLHNTFRSHQYWKRTVYYR